MFRRLRARLDALLRARRYDRELDDEMSFHLERLTEDLVRRGMAPEQARREARLRFGSVERAKSRTREERGLVFFDEVSRNVRFALRGMARSPLFTVTSILTLALCVGLGAAVFSVVNAVLWRPLPYPHPEDLALATLYDPSHGKPVSYAAVDGRTWERIRDEGAPFQRAVYSDWIRGVNLSTDGAAAFVQQQRIGAGYFRTLGVEPEIGREFDPAEDVPDGPPVAILSHELWTRTFGADPDIVGRVIRLKGEAHTVVGVMPAGFPFQADVWTPLRASRTGEGEGTNYGVLVRIPRGMTFGEADARFASIQPPPSTPEGAPERRFGLLSYDRSRTAGIKLPMLIFLGAIGLMLLVGCANLAGLQIARSLARRSEIATRQALGGGAGALVRQILTENLLLGMIGGALGLGVADVGLNGLGGMIRSHFSFSQDIGMDRTALVSVLGLTVLATVLFGLAPVLQVAKPKAHRLLVSGTRTVVGGGGHLLRKILVVGEVALVTALLFAAGLLVRSYGHLEGLNPGFDPDGVLTVQFSLDDARYADGDSVRSLFRETLADIGRIPGVTSAAVALTLPYERPLNLGFRLPSDEEGHGHTTNAVYVTPEFFRTLKIPLLRGRTFGEGDREGSTIVAVANQAFVHTYMDDSPALGTRVSMGFGSGDGVEIVGVVGNVRQAAGWGSATEPVWDTPTLYFAAAQASGPFLQQVHVWFAPSWIIRGAGAQPDLAARVSRVFQEVAPDLPVARMASLHDIMDQAFSDSRFEAAFLVMVAAFALLLAGIGLYGIVAHEVLERQAEMGLRMALGSSPARAVWTAGTTGVRLTLFGLVVGAGLSVAVARVMGHLIYGITSYDPLTLFALLGVLALLTALASFLPAARVGWMDPAAVLREG